MKPIQLISPVDGSVYAERMPLSAEAAQAAVARARAAQKPWAARPLAERIALVKAGVANLNAMKDVVVEELAWQMGRPTRFSGEFGGVNARTAYMSDIAAATLSPTMVEDSGAFRRFIAREALGVVFIVAPWNYPYLTTINTLVPALIAGNTVVLKHASQTMLVGERLAEAFHAGGIPADVFQNVVLDHATTEHLIGARAFNFVNFTGSVGGGQAMERAAAGTFTPLGLELGGKDPGYVRADANLEAAIDTLMDGAMYNAGQCCCGIERIYVHESLYDAFVEGAVKWVSALKLGNPFDAETTLGPMANKRFAAVVRGQVAEATGANAFFVRAGKLYTPTPDCFLDGITRQTVIDLARRRGIEVIEQAIWPEELESFEQFFLTGSAAEVTAVQSAGPWNFEVGDMTRQLARDYDDLVNRRANF